jgi:hypothetical protein
MSVIIQFLVYQGSLHATVPQLLGHSAARLSAAEYNFQAMTASMLSNAISDG